MKGHSMISKLKAVFTVMAVSCISCAVLVDGPQDTENTEGDTYIPLQRTIYTGGYFPFENNMNWWMYTEDGGNLLSVRVTDTISDDHITYYRVSFQENRVDTTDDWFKRSGGDILFGSSLTGVYRRFLPARLNLVNGHIESPDSNLCFGFYDSMVVKGRMYREILHVIFRTPLIHGFKEVWMADNVGIIMMEDNNGRWPVIYSLDSCSINP